LRPNNNIAVVDAPLRRARECGGYLGSCRPQRALGSRRGFPYSDVYLGLDNVLGCFFARLFADFEDWHTEPNEFFEVDNGVIALGTYSARAKAIGTTFRARFAHVWMCLTASSSGFCSH
jgi:uncharacterized protein